MTKAEYGKARARLEAAAQRLMSARVLLTEVVAEVREAKVMKQGFRAGDQVAIARAEVREMVKVLDAEWLAAREAAQMEVGDER